jgi:hypothetical protein
MQLLAPRRVGPKKRGDGTRQESGREFIIRSLDGMDRQELYVTVLESSRELSEGVQIFF